MTQLTPTGLVRILGEVSAILVLTIIGGTIAGIILDRVLGTSPFWVLVGLGVGSLAAILGIGLYIRAGQRRLRGTVPTATGSVREDDS